MSQPQTAASTGRIALVLGVVGLILGASALGYAVYLGLSQFPSQLSAVTINQPCSTTAPCADKIIRVEWTTALESHQDRFYPNDITVVQGDNVTIFFITNDTSDGHTFSLTLGLVGLPSSDQFVLNNSWAGLTSGPYIGVLNGVPKTVHPAPNGIFCCLADGRKYNPQDNFTAGPAGCMDRTSTPTTCNTKNADGNSSYKCNAYNPIQTNNKTNTVPCDLWSFGGLGVVTTPGIYQWVCFFHRSAGMLGYITVLPNKGFTP